MLSVAVTFELVREEGVMMQKATVSQGKEKDKEDTGKKKRTLSSSLNITL